MSTIVCQVCRHAVATDARRCPQCGHSIRDAAAPWIIGIGVAILLAGVALFVATSPVFMVMPRIRWFDFVYMSLGLLAGGAVMLSVGLMRNRPR